MHYSVIRQFIPWIKGLRFLILIIAATVITFWLSGSMSGRMDKFWASTSVKQNFAIHFLKQSFNTSFFILPNLGRCQAKPKYLVVVLSRVASFAVRDAIRLTWASSYNSATIKAGKVVVYFIVGLVNDENIMLRILEENQIYSDLIGLNLSDEYSKLTLKVYAAMYFKKKYCDDVDYFVKTDDDIIMDPDRLMQLSIIMSDSGSLYGTTRANEAVIRSKWNRYYVPKERYAETHYPVYAAGMLYIIPSRALTKIWKKINSSTWINIEDAFYTGIVAELAKVTRINISDWYSFKNEPVLPEKWNCDATGRPTILVASSFHEDDHIKEFYKRFKNLKCLN